MTTHTPDSYDALPYDSVPVHETHPAYLELVGSLFGMSPANATHCRYLELGCASGGNLIPLAFALPDSEFIGIERSAAQAAAGQALIQTLGLRNIRIEQADVMDYNVDALGRLDYVVAHGFYSWVPDAVRARMFEIVSAALTPQGIAYVSYNVYPGWRWRGMVRDLVRYAARNGRSPSEQLALAQAAIRQTAAALAGHADPVAKLMCDELAILQTRHPSYLYHEYLVAENTPCLFSDFMTIAERHGLQYLAETELHTMFSDGLGTEGGAMVDAAADIVAQEQIMDLLRLRMFRQTLLCRNSVGIERELDLDRFAGLAYHASLECRAAQPLNVIGERTFVTPEGDHCVVTHPLTEAALIVLTESYPDAVAYPVLVERAAARVRAAGGPADEADALLLELLRLFLRQFIGASRQPEAIARGDRIRPRVTALARAQVAAELGHVATLRHKPMEVDPVMARLIELLDGERDRRALTTALIEDFRTGRLTLQGPLPPERELTRNIDAHLTRLLKLLEQQGLLEPEDRNS